MTKPTPHGQVPEALIDLIDTYAATCYRYGGIYNAKTEAARNAVIEALSWVQALSAAPAEQQAAPKAAPVEPSDVEIDAFLDSPAGITWVIASSRERYRLLARAVLAKWAAPQQEAQEPVAYVHVPHYTVEGKVHPVVSFEKYQQDYADGIYSTRIPLYAAPQPAPAPLSEMPYEKRKAIQEGEQIGASDAWFKARHEMLDTVDRRNVFRAGFDRGWSAALAAQGGKV